MSNLLKYDVIYILDPNATGDDATAVGAKIEQIVADAKGTVLKKDDWGKRRLAYLVQKHREGHYFFYHLSVPPETVAEITRNLRLLEKVIKFTVVKDTISHLKPKPRPVRTPRPAGAEGSGPRSSGPRPTQAPVNPSPKPAEAPSETPTATNP
jgi:small subunit ribosomal protein S6